MCVQTVNKQTKKTHNQSHKANPWHSIFLQKVLGDFFHGQLLFHAKALEIFTHAYQSLMIIDEEQDLEVSSQILTGKLFVMSCRRLFNWKNNH